MTTQLTIADKLIAAPFPVKDRRNELTLTRNRKHPPLRVILHVDMTFSSAATEKTLEKRRLSTHFGVDGDAVDGWATVWQWLDPMKYAAAHAGEANATSIGIDVNTPLDLKYADRDAKKREGRRRPVVKGPSRGQPREVLGLFPEQLRSLHALAEILRDHAEIQMKYLDNGGEAFPDWQKWLGWLGHNALPSTDHWCPGPVGHQMADYWAEVAG